MALPVAFLPFDPNCDNKYDDESNEDNLHDSISNEESNYQQKPARHIDGRIPLARKISNF